jgi:copper resistance protein B
MKKIVTMSLVLAALGGSAHAGMVDDPLLYKVTIEGLEKQDNDEKALSWDGNIWVGYDLNKIYLYSEGENPEHGKIESEHQLVYSRAIAPHWDVQVGAGYDKTEDADHNWGVIALSGMAPYFFETRAALLIGEDGAVGVRFETEYEALITQRLVLSPSLSAAMYSKDVPEIELGKGLSNVTAGLRLRYEITREIAPYVGFEWSRNFGNTDDFHALDETYGVAGLRVWF